MSWLLTSAPKGDSGVIDSKLEATRSTCVSPMKNAQEADLEKKQLVRVVTSLKKGAVGVPLRGNSKRLGLGKNSMPGDWNLWPIIRGLKLRFASSTALSTTTGQITPVDVFGAIGVVGRVANTSVTALATSFRIRCVRLWIGPSGAGYATGSIMFFSANSDQEPDFEKCTAQTINYQSTPQLLEARPPKNSTASFWYRDIASPLNTPIFMVSCSTTGCLVEVELDFTLPTGIASSQVITVSTAAVGTFYRLSLNKTNGSSNLTVLNFSSTT